MVSVGEKAFRCWAFSFMYRLMKMAQYLSALCRSKAASRISRIGV